MWYWCKSRQIDQWNRMENPETDPGLCEDLLGDRDGIADGSGKIGYSYKKNEIKSWWIKDLNM